MPTKQAVVQRQPRLGRFSPTPPLPQPPVHLLHGARELGFAPPPPALLQHPLPPIGIRSWARPRGSRRSSRGGAVHPSRRQNRPPLFGRTPTRRRRRSCKRGRAEQGPWWWSKRWTTASTKNPATAPPRTSVGITVPQAELWLVLAI